MLMRQHAYSAYYYFSVMFFSDHFHTHPAASLCGWKISHLKFVSTLWISEQCRFNFERLKDSCCVFYILTARRSRVGVTWRGRQSGWSSPFLCLFSFFFSYLILFFTLSDLVFLFPISCLYVSANPKYTAYLITYFCGHNYLFLSSGGT